MSDDDDDDDDLPVCVQLGAHGRNSGVTMMICLFTCASDATQV